MGFVSDQERQEVQCLSKIYPEINEALRKAEDLMATWAVDNAVAPPPELKEKVMANLGDQIPEPIQMESPKPTPKVIDLEPKPSETAAKPPVAWLAAAAAVLLAMYIAWEWQASLSLQEDMKAIIVEQSDELDVIEGNLQNLQLDQSQMEQKLAVLSDPNMQKVALNSVDESKTAAATIYWNPEEKKTYFYRNNLPPEPTEAQYQLWAIVRGKPVSIGLLALNDLAGLQSVEGVERAEAFAITLEPLGGSESPTLEQMVVLGKV